MSEKIKVLITGEHGYIGGQLKSYLEKEELFCVKAISVRNAAWKEADFEEYDAIVHLAGIVHQPHAAKEIYEQVNVQLTKQLAEKAKAAEVKQFVLFSTASVYGSRAGKISLETPEAPDNFYGKSKLQAEKSLQEMATENFKICIVRPPMVYGKGCKGNYGSLAKMAKKLPAFPNIKNKRSMIYIENLCEFTKWLLINQEAGIFFPQDKELVQTAKMVAMIAAESNHKIWVTRLLNPLVLFGKCMPGKIGKLCRKAFGDWYYEESMSAYKEAYCKKTLGQAIHDMENEEMEKKCT